MALDQLLGRPLVTPEWYVLCSKPEPGNALGLSVRRADDVTTVRQLVATDVQTFVVAGAGRGMGTTAFVRSLSKMSDKYPDASETLRHLLRQISPPAAAAPAAPTPATAAAAAALALPSLAGATLLGRSSGGSGGGGGLGTPTNIKRLPVLRPRVAAGTPSTAAAASPATAKPPRGAGAKKDPPKAEPPGTPPGFTYLYSVGDVCKHSADGNRKVEIIEVGSCACCACACMLYICMHTYNIHTHYTCMCMCMCVVLTDCAS